MSDLRVEAPTMTMLVDWGRMRRALWPEIPEADNLREMRAMVKDVERFFVRIALDKHDRAVAFVEASLRRDYVNGCESSPVVFLEGIYVTPEERRRGVAQTLVNAVGVWGREAGCREFASDALLDNALSQAVHQALGFKETERVVYFRKELD